MARQLERFPQQHGVWPMGRLAIRKFDHPPPPPPSPRVWTQIVPSYSPGTWRLWKVGVTALSCIQQHQGQKGSHGPWVHPRGRTGTGAGHRMPDSNAHYCLCSPFPTGLARKQACYCSWFPMAQAGMGRPQGTGEDSRGNNEKGEASALTK